jgi:ankyrin repeat protein
MLAALNGHRYIVENVLAKGNVDVNAFDKNWDTPLKMAAEHGWEAIVRLLLASPNVDATIRSTKDGHNAMSVAQANGWNKIVALLQEFKSRTTAGDLPELPAQSSLQEDGSDSDRSEHYFDAEEMLQTDIA